MPGRPRGQELGRKLQSLKKEGDRVRAGPAGAAEAQVWGLGSGSGQLAGSGTWEGLVFEWNHLEEHRAQGGGRE